VAVQVVRYERRRVVVLKHLGSAHDERQEAALMSAARNWIEASTLQTPAFADSAKAPLSPDMLRLQGISHRFMYAALTGFAVRCGFGSLGDRLLLDLPVMRLVEPSSKLRAITLLDTYFGVCHAERTLYRNLPRIRRHKAQAERIAVAYAKETLSSDPALVLYDVMTLYFETFKADELRVPGFSKDNKPQQPQVVLGLLFTREGFPLAPRPLGPPQRLAWNGLACRRAHKVPQASCLCLPGTGGTPVGPYAKRRSLPQACASNCVQRVARPSAASTCAKASVDTMRLRADQAPGPLALRSVWRGTGSPAAGRIRSHRHLACVCPAQAGRL